MSKQEREIIWVVVNTNSVREADKIGRTVLKQRLCACFGIYSRMMSVYFWPPKTSKQETSKGPLLVLETLPAKYKKISQLVKSLHSDKLPFIGRLEIKEVENKFYQWLKNEVQH